MKKINILFMLLAVCCLVSCNDDPLDSLTGTYDMDRYVFTSVTQQPAVKLKKGIKSLNMTLENDGHSAEVSFGSSEWILPSGTYTPTATVAADGEYALTVDGQRTAASGDLDVAIVGDIYYITGLLTDASGEKFMVSYKGALSFEIGIDDPEASGYTITLTEGTVSDASGTTYPELTKYVIVVSDPSGSECAEFHAVNKAGLSLKDLAGTYTVQGYPTQAGLMDNGWVVYYPEYYVEMAGGTYFTDANGVKQYVTSGEIAITVAEDADGNTLYSFTGSGLSTLTAKNEAGSDASFKILYASHTELKGTVLRDQTMKSTVLGIDMKYSVFLPESWDGTKTYPVLYLLHGADGSNNDWITGGGIDSQVSAAVAAGTAPEMIVIMPNCTVDGKNLFYVNGYQGDAQYMTYFFDEFLPTVESLYNVQSDREHRMIGGLSMGGYGALYYGALHPEMFSYVYACSPATYVDGTPNIYDIYGADVSDGKQIPGITIEIGTSDYLYEYAGYFKQYLDAMGITNEYITRDGSHDWNFWAACTPKIVGKAGSIFK